jgi:hypothetical protein
VIRGRQNSDIDLDLRAVGGIGHDSTPHLTGRGIGMQGVLAAEHLDMGADTCDRKRALLPRHTVAASPRSNRAHSLTMIA